MSPIMKPMVILIKKHDNADKMIIHAKVIVWVFSGNKYPKKENANKLSKNPLTNIARLPSTLLTVFVYLMSILCFPYLRPTSDATVSLIIMTMMDDAGKKNHSGMKENIKTRMLMARAYENGPAR